jgi:thioredoxin reductase
MNTPYDVAVIGGGAAGLSAALVLTRARRSVVVIDSGRPRNAPAAHMQGFLSRDGLPPTELLRLGRAEVASYGGQFLAGTVVRIRQTDGRFEVELADGAWIGARRVLLATGLTDQYADVPGLRERWGKDVLHCPYCHGYEVRDGLLGVLGGTPGAVEHALLIRQWSDDVVFFAHTSVVTDDEWEQLRARTINVLEGPVAGLVVDEDRLQAVQLADGRVVARTALFVRPSFLANNDVLRALGGDVDAQGWPVVDATGRTSVPGVWAAGNAVNPRAQVITAAGEGSAAAIALNNDLVAEDVRHVVATLRATSAA